MGNALIKTLEHTSKIITLLISASLYVLIFKGLGGDQLLELFYENFAGNNNLVILVSFMILVLVGRIFTPVIALLIVVPVLIPHLLMLVKTGVPEFNTLWIGILIIITLQILGFYTISMNGIEKNINNQSSIEMLKPQIYQTKIPLIILQILILALCWLFPTLVLGLGAAI
jgi:TRAP-type mannitol/chloroaromatic compound transport system permease large subunit